MDTNCFMIVAQSEVFNIRTILNTNDGFEIASCMYFKEFVSYFKNW